MLKAIPYWGGKSRTDLTRWIVGMLPPVVANQSYCEPCAGMLGVLLNRPKATGELVFDANDSLVTWWRVVRDHPDELARRLRYTPRARREFEAAMGVLFGDRAAVSAMDVAWAVSVVLCGSMVPTVGNPRAKWYPSYGFGGVRIGKLAQRIEAVADRIRDVQLDTQPAEYTLAKLANSVGDDPKVIYVDPPYYSAACGAYGEGMDSIDVGEWTELLQAQPHQVAISGYASEWDHLGWVRRERTVKKAIANSKDKHVRTEVLWTNYEPPAPRDPEEGQIGLFDGRHD